MADGYKGEKKKSEILLWHRRLEHASFGYLKKLFPNLFSKSDISGFCYDICELAKNHRASFLLIEMIYFVCPVIYNFCCMIIYKVQNNNFNINNQK